MIVGMWSEGNQTHPMEIRTLADWVVRQRLLTIPGVSQVTTMGGQRKQFQVLVNPASLLSYGVTLHEVETALEKSNSNVTGGYLDSQGPKEYLVRALGRIRSIEDLQELVVKIRDGRPVLLRQVARVVEGPQVKRGDSSAFDRVQSPESRVQSPESRVQSRKEERAGVRILLLSTLDSRLSTPSPAVRPWS